MSEVVMAYLKGFSHGLMAGMVLGVMVAPRRGSETRAAIELNYRRARRTAERAVAGAQSGWQTAQPALALAGRAAEAAGRMVQPVVQSAGDRIAQRTSRPGFSAAPSSPFDAVDSPEEGR